MLFKLKIFENFIALIPEGWSKNEYALNELVNVGNCEHVKEQTPTHVKLNLEKMSLEE